MENLPVRPGQSTNCIETFQFEWSKIQGTSLRLVIQRKKRANKDERKIDE